MTPKIMVAITKFQEAAFEAGRRDAVLELADAIDDGKKLRRSEAASATMRTVRIDLEAAIEEELARR